MNRIDQRFAELKARGEKAFLPYITAGDPTLALTEQIVLELDRAGADIVEFGVPYTDPLADGPVNQEAAARALKHHVRLADIVATMRRLTGLI